MNSFFYRAIKWIKDSAVGIILTSIAIVFVICVALLVGNNKSTPVSKTSDVSDTKVIVTVPSESTQPITEKVRLPFTVDAKIARYFFDSEDSIDIRSQALIQYEGKYLPSLGVDYTFDNTSFNVVSSFSGKVVSKVNDSLYGLTICVENDDGLKAYYSGLSEVNVYQDQKIEQGQILGKSGESVINAELGKHLHFALQLDSTYLNPLKLYDKAVSEIV